MVTIREFAAGWATAGGQEKWRGALAGWLGAAAQDWLEHRLDIVSTAIETWGESPIERLMLVALVAELGIGEPGTKNHLVGRTVKDRFPIETFMEWHSMFCDMEDDQLEDCMISLGGQVCIAEYRVDALVAARYLRSEPKKDLLIVVESDGHDFHERTKEQAQRDKARDRDLQSQGFRVFRFTGSEIYRDPLKCAAEVRDLIDKWVDGCNAVRLG